jgi:hypothetical protein
MADANRSDDRAVGNRESGAVAFATKAPFPVRATWFFAPYLTSPVLARVIVGAVLIVAAALKTRQLLSYTGGMLNSALPQWFTPVLIFAEAFVGLWLISGLAPRASCAIALALFSGFASYSLVEIIRGDPSCGCFGEIQSSPWFALTLDLAAIGALLTTRPTRMESCAAAPSETGQTRAFRFAALELPVLGIIVGASLALSGPSSVSALQPSRLVKFDKRDINLGMLEKDQEEATATFTMTNVSATPLVIDSIERSCGCMTTEPEQNKVRPGESTSIPVRIALGSLSGRFMKNLILHLHEQNGEAESVELRLVGDRHGGDPTNPGTIPNTRLLAASPATLDFGDVATSGSLTRELNVFCDESVAGSIPGEVTVQHGNPTIIPLTVTDGVSDPHATRLSKTVHVKLDRTEGDPILDSKIVFRFVNSFDEYAVPVKARFDRPVSAQPSCLFITEPFNGHIDVQIVETSHRGTPVLRSVTSDVPVMWVASQDQNKLIVRVSPKKESQAWNGMRSGNLYLSVSLTSGPADLKIPVIIVHLRPE